MGSKKISLIIAVIVGLVAMVGLLLWARGLESESSSNGELQSVYIVETQIEKGTGKEEILESIVQTDLPGAFVPANAITDPDAQIQAGHLAVADFGPGHTIVSTDFQSRRVSGSGLSAVLSERNLVSVSVTVGPSAWAAGLIQPGDRVNVLAVGSTTPFWGDDIENAPEEISPQAAGEAIAAAVASTLEATYVPLGLRQAIGVGADGDVPSFDELSDVRRQAAIDWWSVNGKLWLDDTLQKNAARYLVQDVEVLAINTALVAGLGGDSAAVTIAEPQSAVITLAVAPEDVQVILNASAPNTAGDDGIYLSLVPQGYTPRVLPPLDPSTQVTPAEDIEALTSSKAGSILNILDGLTVGEIPASTAAAPDAAPAAETANPPLEDLIPEEG